MKTLKLLRQNLNFILFAPLDNYPSQSIWWQSANKAEQLKNIEIPREEKIAKIKEYISEKWVVSLEDNPELQQKIKDWIDNNTFSDKQINKIYNELVKINNIEQSILTPKAIENLRQEANNDKLKKEFDSFRKMYKKHLAFHLTEVVQAEEMMCKTLWECDWVDEAKKMVLKTTWTQVDRLKKSVDLSDKIKDLKLTSNQQGKVESYYKTLPEEQQEKLVSIIEKNPKLIKNILDIYSEMSSKDIIDKFSNELKTKKEKYKDNPEVLKKIWEIQKRLSNDLSNFAKVNKDYSLIFNELLKSNNPWIDIAQKIKTLELTKEEIWNLDIALQIMEFSEEKQKRYKWLQEEYKKVKQVKEFKDIIWEKKFDDLTAWDFYAVLKTAPEKVRSLLLSTIDWKSVWNISRNWEAYKGKVLKVNFGKNKWLDRIVWAWDILDIFNVKSVKINWVEWIRKASPRPGYYTKEGHYLAIHDWYTIEITDATKLEGKQEIEEFKNAQNKRFDEIRGTEIKTSLKNMIDEEIKKHSNAKEIQIPYKAKVDREYINSFINKEENKYLGLEIIKDWKIKVWEKFNIWHLWEALSWYAKTKEKIVDYIEKNKNLSDLKEISLNIEKLWLNNNQYFLKQALKNIIWNKDVKITIDKDNVIIDSSNTNLKIGDIFSTDYEYKWNRHRHEKYMSEIISASQKYWVPKGAIIQLIYHENTSWNPNLKYPWSSAYWLWQFVDSTWSRFGSGDRNNPSDQLMAVAKYLKYLKTTKNCSWEETLAYYNTGPWIMRVWNINKYYNLNPAITRKQPSWISRTNKNYFIAAIAYYNDISFIEAKPKVKSI